MTPASRERQPPSKAALWRRAISRAPWLLPFVLWALDAGITWRQAVDVPYWDSWESTELVTGLWPLNFTVLWSQANEHRIPLQKLYEVGWARLTGWDHWLAAFVPLLLILAAAIVFIRRAVGGRPSLTPVQRTLLIAILSSWFLTPRQTDFLVWGIHFSWAVLILVFVAFESVWGRFLEEGRLAWTIPALIVVAVSATGQGLALCLFLIGAAALSLLPIGVSPRRAVWPGLLGLGAFALYFPGFSLVRENPGMATPLREPVAALKYCATYAGGPFSGLTLAGAIGAAGGLITALAVLSLCRRRGGHGIRDLVVRYPLLTLSTVLMLAIMAGRLGFGTEQAIVSRYVPFAVLLASTALLLALDELLVRRPALVTGSLAGVLLATVPLWCVGYPISERQAAARRAGLVRYRDCILAGGGACDGSWAYPDPQKLERRTELLRRHGLSFFRPY